MDMTITKVEGNVVHASGSYRGGAQGFQNRGPAKGTVEGNTLRIGKSIYTISGETMTGSNDTSDLSLTKLK